MSCRRIVIYGPFCNCLKGYYNPFLSILGERMGAHDEVLSGNLHELNPGTYKNPILHLDFSDPDIFKLGSDFYLIASSFNCIPGLPVLHSKDLINWEIISYALSSMPWQKELVPHGGGVWAPSIRYNNSTWYIYFCDPDNGLFLVTANDPKGPWSEPHCVKEVKGWIDPCPLWDDDGSCYLVHAVAKSRYGRNSLLMIHKMSVDGKTLLDDGEIVFDSRNRQPVIEGPKFVKRNGFYYIFAPAGGVVNGWQVVLRSDSIYGPYDEKVALYKGKTNINGPHQGGPVEFTDGSWWFIHFQDKGVYGRILHLQPMQWIEDWPVIGEVDQTGIGTPVNEFKTPDPETVQRPFSQTTDLFPNGTFGLQWQWQGLPNEKWYGSTDLQSGLRLHAQPFCDNENIWMAPNLLLQKFPSENFAFSTQLTLTPQYENERGGVVVFGKIFSYCALVKYRGGIILVLVLGNGPENVTERLSQVPLDNNTIWIRCIVNSGGIYRWFYSYDNEDYYQIGTPLFADNGKWIGSKIGIFAGSPLQNKLFGYCDFNSFSVSNL